MRDGGGFETPEGQEGRFVRFVGQDAGFTAADAVGGPWG